MSGVRMHFWMLVARVQGGVCWPTKYGTNCTMPALTNNRLGSSNGSGTLGTTVWPLRSKCPRKRERISAVCTSDLAVVGRRHGRSAVLVHVPTLPDAHRRVR